MNIGLDIYNLRGQFVESIFKGKLNEGVHQFYWSPSSISSGTYFIHVSNGKHSQFKKTIYLKKLNEKNFTYYLPSTCVCGIL